MRFLNIVRKMSTLSTKIGTHNGHFHCDEVLAVYMLKQLPKYKESPIIRYELVC